MVAKTQKGRLEQGKKSLLWITSLNRKTGTHTEDAISMTVHTTVREGTMTKGGSYLDAFKGGDLRRT